MGQHRCQTSKARPHENKQCKKSSPVPSQIGYTSPRQSYSSSSKPREHERSYDKALKGKSEHQTINRNRVFRHQCSQIQLLWIYPLCCLLMRQTSLLLGISLFQFYLFFFFFPSITKKKKVLQCCLYNSFSNQSLTLNISIQFMSSSKIS